METGEIIKKLDDFIIDLTSIVNEVRQSGDFDKAYEDLKRWKGRVINYLYINISQIEAENLKNKSKSSFIMGEPYENLVDEINMYRAFIISLAGEIKNHPDEVIIQKKNESKPVLEEKHTQNNSKTVFIIHGHDEINLLRLKELLREKWHLEPLVLKGEADTGRTLIEKFEQEAQRASFAIALLSADDKIQNSKEEYFQARPNVIFELGWFYGRLGRNKVCILSKKGIKIHSDLKGIMRKDFENTVEEKFDELESELRKAGLIG